MRLGPSSLNCLYFQDFESSELFNVCFVIWPDKQILSVFLWCLAFVFIIWKHFWNIWNFILMFADNDLALKTALLILFWKLVAYDRVWINFPKLYCENFYGKNLLILMSPEGPLWLSLMSRKFCNVAYCR